MKTKNALLLYILALTCAVTGAILTGCSSGPNAVERALFNVSTNYEASVEAGTNDAGEPVYMTNLVERVVYEAKDSTEIGAKVGGGMLGGFFGMGELLSVLFTGAIGIYANVRSRKVTKAALQGVQVAREILKTTQGQAVENAYKGWLKENQRTAGVIRTVAGMVDKYVDHPAAKEAAEIIAQPMGSGGTK